MTPESFSNCQNDPLFHSAFLEVFAEEVASWIET